MNGSNEIYAIIPARAGSKGVKDKNIKPLSGYPLIAYSIAVASLCPYIDRVIVSTDSEKYATISKYYGADVPFLRPSVYAQDTSTDIEFMGHCINWLSENEDRLPDYFVHIRPTTPLREINIVNKAVEEMVNDLSATSLRSAHLSSHTPYKWVHMRDGYYEPFVKGMTMDQVNNPRQDFEAVYIPDGYVDVLKTEFVKEHNLMHGDKVHGFIVPDSVDVDMMNDLNRVSYILENEGHPLLDYLREHYKPINEVQF